MNALVVYESQFGNTEKLALLIGKELEAIASVRVMSFLNYQPSMLVDVDLLVIGAPTQAHGMTTPMKEFIERLAAEGVAIPLAVFDTRVKGPMILWGSAAKAIAAKLAPAGFKLIGEPENFIVSFARPPKLETGEEEHARTWAAGIAANAKAARAA